MRHILLTVILLLVSVASGSAGRLLEPVSPDCITAHGWLADMMHLQEINFTGKLDQTGFPFDAGGWGGAPFLRTRNGVSTGFWVPYEQTAYYYDGMLRLGLVMKSDSLVAKTRKAIYNTVENASKEGILCPVLNTGNMRRWPHAVFFRAFMAEYEATQNKKIINALERHYKNDTVRYEERDLCNVEILAWLYRITGDGFFKEKAMSMLDAPCLPGYTLKETMEQFGSKERTEIHAVTFHELLKMPVLFYELTGDEKYLDMARNAFAKIDRYNMLPDGISSGEEGLSGNGSRNVHEMCNVVDYIWTCTYMLRATKDIEYADRIECALFNAGLGGITKNFDAHQYYSAPNQIYCSDYSSHVSTYDPSRMAYRQIHRPPCCTGNINRMLPIYASSQWMTDDDGNIYKMLYGPGEVRFGGAVLREHSAYPFNQIWTVKVESGKTESDLYLRIPGWAKAPFAEINGNPIPKTKDGKYFVVRETLKKGDVIELGMAKSPEYTRWDSEAMVLRYGPLLMALPVKAEVRQYDILTPKLQSYSYKGYSMKAASDWNYILGVADEKDGNMAVDYMELSENDNPWTMEESPVKITVPAYLYPEWKEDYRKHVTAAGDEITVPVMPSLPARGAMIYALNGLKPEAVTLVPYGRTTLRISMFPFWRTDEIPAEVLATDNE